MFVAAAASRRRDQCPAEQAAFHPTSKVTLDAIAKRVEKSEMGSQSPEKPAKLLHILLVEDHSDTRQTLSRLLTYFGHQISVADNTQSSLETVQSQKFDVVLCVFFFKQKTAYEMVSQAK